MMTRVLTILFLIPLSFAYSAKITKESYLLKINNAKSLSEINSAVNDIYQGLESKQDRDKLRVLTKSFLKTNFEKYKSLSSDVLDELYVFFAMNKLDLKFKVP